MPDPRLADVDIANRALNRIGERAITALDEDSDVAAQVVAVYHDVVDAAFAAYQWKWCRRTEALEALAPPDGQTTFNGWPHAFSFPDNVLSQPLGLYVRWPSTPLRDFAVEGPVVFARVPQIFGTFTRRISPDEWPPNFRIAVVTWLAAELALPVTHDKDLAASLMVVAVGNPGDQMRGGLIGRAIAFDVATGGPQAAFSEDPVTQARYEGPWWGGNSL